VVVATALVAGCTGADQSPPPSPEPSITAAPLPSDYLAPHGDGYTAQDLIAALAPDGTDTVLREDFELLFEASSAGIPHALPPAAGPLEPPAMIDAATPGSFFEIGLVDRAALQHWMCTWMDALLSGDVDEPTGLAALELVPTLPHAYVLSEPEVEQLSDAAAAGVEGYDFIQRMVCPTPQP